ncbi:MAG: hypothetical protein IKO19_11315 [Candidatus Riflebacteria bacterium]|nr:hypothetical protein [Candidatus Riflebacteria bacterium]
MGNWIYVLIGIIVLVILFILGCWINIKKQKELREKLKNKVVFNDQEK